MCLNLSEIQLMLQGDNKVQVKTDSVSVPVLKTLQNFQIEMPQQFVYN